MDATELATATTIIGGIAIVVGVFGTVVPFMPGLVVSWTGVLLWAWFSDLGRGVWVTFGIVSLLAVTGVALKYLLPGQRLRRDGVPNRSLVVGGLLGIVGFFVIPVIGLVVGFVLGIFAAELVRLDNAKLAWPSTWHAVKAVGLSMLIEMGAGVLILTTWVSSLLLL